MTQAKFTIFFMALVCMNATYIFAQSNVEVNEEIAGQLDKFRGNYIKSLLEGQPELVTDHYSEDTRLMPEFQKTIFGKSNASLYHQAFLKRFYIKEYSREEIEMLDLGSHVTEIGKFTMVMIIKSTGQEYELKGAYLNIWKEMESNGLLLVTEAWNYDHYYAEIDNHLRFEEVPAVHVALQPNVPVNSNISFELAALNRLLDATVTHHDANLWSRYYADDAILIPNYHPICPGRKAIDEYIATHVKELPVFEALDIRNDHINDLGNYVIEYASHIASWKNGGSSGVGMGKNIRIWRREQDHSLKLFRSMGMYD